MVYIKLVKGCLILPSWDTELVEVYTQFRTQFEKKPATYTLTYLMRAGLHVFTYCDSMQHKI